MQTVLTVQRNIHRKAGVLGNRFGQVLRKALFIFNNKDVHPGISFTQEPDYSQLT
jgi:hypothetical protein